MAHGSRAVGVVIARTALVDGGSDLAEGVVIGDFCKVDADVTLGPGTVLEPYVWVRSHTTLGANNHVGAHTVLGSDPLDKNFRGDRSYLRIGDGNIIREHYTISRGTQPDSVTVIGDRNYFMTSGHLAHNCHVGNDNVFASCALVAGHVEIGDRVFLSGGVVVHQHSRIGSYAMVGGNTRVNSDLLPFFLYTGFNVVVKGLNLVGLRRAGFDAEEIRCLKQAYRILFRQNLRLEEALEKMEREVGGERVRELVEFARKSKRGVAREGRSLAE